MLVCSDYFYIILHPGEFRGYLQSDFLLCDTRKTPLAGRVSEKQRAEPKVTVLRDLILDKAEHKLKGQYKVRRELWLCACWKQKDRSILRPDLVDLHSQAYLQLERSC